MANTLFAILLAIIFLVLVAAIIYFVYRTFVRGPPLADLLRPPLFPGVNIGRRVQDIGQNIEDVLAPQGGWVEMVSLTTQQEVPAPMGNISQARGTGNLRLNAEMTQLQYDFVVVGLSSPLMAAHFHRAPPGQPGPIIQPIEFMQTGPNEYRSQGTWNINPEIARDLSSGLIYVNVHTMQNPAGEIRAQIQLPP